MSEVPGGSGNMEIDSIEKLEVIKGQIQSAIQKYRLEDVLLGLRNSPDNLQPFVVGGTALFAIRHCTAGHRTPTVQGLEWNELAPIVDLVTQYLIADPLGFDQELQKAFNDSNPIFTLLRIFGNQIPYAVNLFGQYARPFLLFHELPSQLAGRPEVAQSDFDANFRKINGVSPIDFIKVGFMAFVAARNNPVFTRSYFEAARAKGLNLPGDKEVSQILDNIAADPKRLSEVYHHFQVSDRRFSMYDLNPLFIHPIVRPWRQKESGPMDEDRMIAPLPDLIASRTSLGIFYQMFNHYLIDFSNYFGHIFGAYIGQILKESKLSGNLRSEDDIRKTYPANQGKVPDWIIVNGKTAVLIECKATRFSRAALTTGSEEAIDDNLKQVIKGLRQLGTFIKACEEKRPGLEILHECTTFKPVLITLEPLYLINSELFQKYINDKLAAEGITNLSWLILAMDELERLQPHLAAGIELEKVIDDLHSKPFNAILEEAHSQTGLTYKDSYLFKKQQDLYQQLGYSP